MTFLPGHAGCTTVVVEFEFTAAPCLCARAQKVSCHLSGGITCEEQRERRKRTGRQRGTSPSPDLRKDAPQADQGNKRRGRGIGKPSRERPTSGAGGGEHASAMEAQPR